MVRKEIHTRTIFANERGLYYFNKIIQARIPETGNIFSCKYMKKFLQARRIYIHYTNEYQLVCKLELSN